MYLAQWDSYFTSSPGNIFPASQKGSLSSFLCCKWASVKEEEKRGVSNWSAVVSDSIVVKMSEAEQQYMETSENGHEAEEDFNGGGNDDNAENDCGEGAGTDPDGNSQDGGQIDASKGEEDAG
ncbi:hypothetical protein XENOCAPTIV_019951 [Xenoophorus captivus]|uniref:CARG-binding factor N-terminal domain-containing protein n=1 Tax=Xenoophorus captivus TaxID=1517983 RepID=A0ABV0REF3_9TELE